MEEVQATQTTFRSYLFFWSGQLVSLLGSSIAQFVIIWWITIETESAVYLSLASLVGIGPQVILTPFAGAFVDRWSRKKLIGMVDFFQALATVVLILLFWFSSITYWYVLALLTLRGIFQAFHTPATSAIIPLMVPRDKLSRFNGLNYVFNGSINLIGPVVAALLLSVWKIYQILWIDGFTFLIAVIPLLLIRIPSVKKKQDQPSFKEDFVEGLTFIKNARGMLPLLTTSTMLNFSLTPLFTLLPYYVKFDHLGEAADLALVLAVLQGGLLVGGIFMSVHKGFTKKMRIIIPILCVVYLGFTLISLTPTGLFWFMAFGAFVMSIGIPVANVLVFTIFQTVIPLGLQGRANSVIMALSAAATPLGIILAGALVVLTGTSNLFMACICLGLLTIAVSWFFTDVRYVDQLEQTILGSEN